MKKNLALLTLLAVCTAMPAFANDKMHGGHEWMVDAHFKEADTNNDGMISAEESAACAKKMFTKADTNNDGQVSKEEMTIAMKAKMAMHKGKAGHMGTHGGKADDNTKGAEMNEKK